MELVRSTDAAETEWQRASSKGDSTSSGKGESTSSGVSWGAVIGGAFVAAAFYLVLLALGAGFGLSAISPWSNNVSALGAAAIVWLIFIEVIASAMGGYLTGRLRTKWALIHTDEVYFRDTANGFLAWAVALVITVSLLGSAAASMAGRAAQPAVSAAAASGNPANLLDPSGYFVDTLFRSDRIGSEGRDVSAQIEAFRIFTHALRQNQLSSSDQNYLASLVAVRTGIPPAEAEARVTNALQAAREAEDAARKATAHFLLWSFVALILGALSASYAATIGGRQRDHVKAI